jgi:hypothetical protein
MKVYDSTCHLKVDEPRLDPSLGIEHTEHDAPIPDYEPPE